MGTNRLYQIAPGKCREGRDFRSPNPTPDGPGKTNWGEWFKATVTSSDATFRVLISPTPIVGPDRKKKNDNHSNQGFTYEGDQLPCRMLLLDTLAEFLMHVRNSSKNAKKDRRFQYI